MKDCTEYEIKDLTRHNLFEQFIISAFFHLKKTNPEFKTPERFNFFGYIETHRARICLRNGEPVGLLLCQIYPSTFDPTLKILYQDLLYGKPGTKAAKLLLDDFIAFGKANAQHILTMIAKGTNIKGRSLERLGFTKLEELYRMES